MPGALIIIKGIIQMIVRPFKAVRPDQTAASKVASLPYDVYSEKEARDIVEKNPDSFLKIVRPETVFPEGTDPSSQEVYERARDMIAENIEKGMYVSFEEVLKNTLPAQSKTGFVFPAFKQGDDLGKIKDIKVLINGNDLINLGLKPSENFKTIFEEALRYRRRMLF